MRRIALVLAAAALAAVAGCSSSKDNDLCDFYHSLSAGYQQSQGYTPADVQDEIDKYC